MRHAKTVVEHLGAASAVGAAVVAAMAIIGPSSRMTTAFAATPQAQPAPAPQPVVRRPQEPKPPFPYREEEVTYENRKAGITIAGTLTVPALPAAAARAPAVLLLTGSGAQDRNETIFGHKPFFVLADHLTRLGIAVLRVDDRGVGGSTGSYPSATVFDLADDAQAGVEFLKARREIDPKRIGMLGHSEGGLVAPLVASRTRDVSFLVLLAGPGVNGEEILSAQSALIGRANGLPDEVVEQQRRLSSQMYAVLKQEPDPAAADTKLRAVVSERAGTMSGPMRNAAETQIKTINRPWFRAFLTYDPAPTLRKVSCPVLAINGEKDLQVPPKENLDAIESQLRAGGNKDVTTRVLPGLNHLFQTSTTGAPLEYGQIEETIAPLALDTIAEWLRAHVLRESVRR